jgi:TPR repeat protein
MIRRAVLCTLMALCLAGPPATAQQTTPESLISRAEAGETAAQTALALAYHQGDGVVQNYSTAALWAARAAEAGDATAQNLLGRYYHSGLGVAQSQAEALRWLTAAAAGGDPGYLHDLGRALEHGADGSSDPAAAARAYALAAEAGHLDASVSLGMLYQEGLGVDQDFVRARSLYEAAATQGHARAQNNLGLLYVRGDGVAQDYGTAAQLFTAAAEQGLPDALRNLGVMYENGFGVPLNEALAADLYRQAGQGGDAAQAGPALGYDARLVPLSQEAGLLDRLRQSADAGDPVAQFQLGWSLASAEGADFAALSEAARLFKAAALAGYGPAMRNLGILYFEGRGVPQDYVLGRMWLTLAGSAGQADAPELIQGLGATMTPEQINEAQSRALAHSENKSLVFD